MMPVFVRTNSEVMLVCLINSSEDIPALIAPTLALGLPHRRTSKVDRLFDRCQNQRPPERRNYDMNTYDGNGNVSEVLNRSGMVVAHYAQ